MLVWFETGHIVKHLKEVLVPETDIKKMCMNKNLQIG